MNRILLAVASGVAVFFAVYAVAAAIGLLGDNLVAGSDGVATCDADGFIVEALHYETVTGLIDAITIGDIAIGGIEGECLNGQLTVHLTNAANVSLGSGIALVDGTQVSVLISPHADPVSVAREVMIIVGP